MRKQPTPRHPGLVPGPWLVPGPIQTGRDIKTTPAGCFQDPEYRWGDFGTTDGNIAGAISGRRMGGIHPFPVIPGLLRV